MHIIPYDLNYVVQENIYSEMKQWKGNFFFIDQLETRAEKQNIRMQP